MKFYINRVSRHPYVDFSDKESIAYEIENGSPCAGAEWLGDKVSVETKYNPFDALWSIDLEPDDLLPFADRVGCNLVLKTRGDGPIGELPLIEIYDDYRE